MVTSEVCLSNLGPALAGAQLKGLSQQPWTSSGWSPAQRFVSALTGAQLTASHEVREPHSQPSTLGPCLPSSTVMSLLIPHSLNRKLPQFCDFGNNIEKATLKSLSLSVFAVSVTHHWWPLLEIVLNANLFL